MASKIDLISNALVLIGDLPINTLDGNSRAQVVASALYDNIVKNEISKHRWGWARRKAQLSLLVDTPIDNDWSNAYQMPTDLLVLIKLNPNIGYQIYGDKVYCNLNQALYCDYIADIAESEWPVYFSKMIEYALARDFASSIRDSATSADRMAAEYLNASRMARFTDSQQHPQTPIVSRPFIDVRN
ncbi:hypothetical protein [Pseudoalteromonas marina]|uniref:hypothetical protein n=1 Tax=Pseudoalteromonas marina TaxID=267375 RepID=UPI003C53C648